MIRVRSLQQRMTLFLLLPVAALLIAMGAAGYLFAGNVVLKQWSETVMLRLQRAAHFVDMRLNIPKRWMQKFDRTAGAADMAAVQQWLLGELRGLEGVTKAELTWVNEPAAGGPEPGSGPMMGRGQGAMPGMGRMRFHRTGVARVTVPRYDPASDPETVSLASDLLDEAGRVVGRLDVTVRFDYLTGEIVSKSRRSSTRAFLVDQTGRVLTCNQRSGDREPCRMEASLFQATLEAMKSRPYGSVHGPGRPPREVSGFFGLTEAPWTLVMVGSGREILGPIMRFRLFYAGICVAFVLVVLVLIRVVTSRTVASIKQVSEAAEQVARGHYDTRLPVATSDEGGQLIRSFNTMVGQLEERIRLKEALDLAMEVQQNLLPRSEPQTEQLDIAGMSVYCDETGGDYYDFMQFSEPGREWIGIAVGDVAGHGISAALLMTTVRALLRGRITQPGTPAQMITDVNRLLCMDTIQTGDYMSLFFLLVAPEGKRLRWVRAGHPPAMVYDAAEDSFRDLMGEGPVLGFDDRWAFEQNDFPQWSGEQLIFIGTDGIWETENPAGEMFGKDRLREIIRAHAGRPAREVIEAVSKALTEFRQSRPQEDDITMVVVKPGKLKTG